MVMRRKPLRQVVRPQEIRKQLQLLVAAVRQYGDWMDQEMRGVLIDPTERMKRGQRMAKALNGLLLQAEVAERFGLGQSRKKPKPETDQ